MREGGANGKECGLLRRLAIACCPASSSTKGPGEDIRCILPYFKARPGIPQVRAENTNNSDERNEMADVMHYTSKTNNGD